MTTMKPLRKGVARTALASEIEQLLQEYHDKLNMMQPVAIPVSEQIAALVGGAIEQSLNDFGEMNNEQKATFWRYMNHNLWNLIRSLRASNQLEKV